MILRVILLFCFTYVFYPLVPPGGPLATLHPSKYKRKTDLYLTVVLNIDNKTIFKTYLIY